MNSSVCFEQKGIIESANNNRIRIRIDRESACGHCDVRGICNMAGLSERTIEVDDATQCYTVGETVVVTITRSMGNKAILLGYLLPFFLLITTLVICTVCSFPEWISGILSILVLLPYYFFLYLFRERLCRNITFSIRKII